MADRFTLREDDLSSPAVRDLVAFHLAEAHRNSPPGNVFALDLSGLLDPTVTVWSAWSGERLAGLGALKRLGDDAGEVKSMRTHPDFLRRGVAAVILDRVIAAAGASGLRRLSLETGSGPTFEPAWALYRSRGFQPGGAFGAYRDGGPSRFLHLDLGRSTNGIAPGSC